MDDDWLNRAFGIGIGAGILLGLGSFFIGCPPKTCVAPSLQYTQQLQQGLQWNGR